MGRMMKTPKESPVKKALVTDKKESTVKKYKFFTAEEQAAYEKMNVRRRAYIDYRGQGYGLKQSALMAGFGGNNPSQSGYLQEYKTPMIKHLIEVIQKQNSAVNFIKGEGSEGRKLDALALQENAEKTLEKAGAIDGETAKRIQLYRDIVNGKIKSIKKVSRYNNMGALIDTRVEETSPIEMRIQARKELDKILGLNQLIDVGSIQAGGDITINIVDASKKEELEDDRNKVTLDLDKVEVIDGKEVYVMGEEQKTVNTKKAPKKDIDDDEEDDDEEKDD